MLLRLFHEENELFVGECGFQTVDDVRVVDLEFEVVEFVWGYSSFTQKQFEHDCDFGGPELYQN